MRDYPPRDVTIHRVPGAYVVGEGLAFDRTGAVIGPTITQHSPAEVDAAAAALHAALAAGPIPQAPGETLLCTKRGAGNYGHWLYEMLPIAALGLPELQSGAWRALLPAAQGPLALAIQDSLTLLGVPSTQQVLSSDAPQRFESLLVAAGLTAHGGYISPLVTDCLAALAQGVPADGSGRLWVSRAGDHRSLWNEAELAAVLAAAGWTICRPGTMPLARQIALFRGARHIAGVSGAGLTNIAFAAPGARVTVFAPAAMPDTFFWLLSELCGHDYTEIRCRHADRQGGLNPWDSALVLSLPDALACLL